MDQLPQAVLIDTDIGNDVDDAFALALATVLPQLQLCGVTTVSGPVKERARLARQILHATRQPHVPMVAPAQLSSRTNVFLMEARLQGEVLGKQQHNSYRSAHVNLPR